MAKALSRDGTSIAFDRTGSGPALILVDGALCYRASGPCGPLAAEAATRGVAITKLALYEAPFIVDDSRSPVPPDIVPQLNGLVAFDRRGDAVKLFMKLVGVPAVFIALMRLLPAWSKLKAVAHTLPYDMTIVQDNQRGNPLPAARWANTITPTLVMDGGKSPAWMRHGMRQLANILPNAKYRTLEGQTHMVKAKAHVPALVEFFA